MFRVVSFPDPGHPARHHHVRYLSAACSSRYRYDVTEARGGPDLNLLKGEVSLGGTRLCGMLRVEYAASRLRAACREHGRRLGPTVKARVKVLPADENNAGETTVTLHWDPVIGAYAAEIWETLEPPAGVGHDHRVLVQMGRDAPITRASELVPALGDLPALRRVAVAFREDDRLFPTQQAIGDPQWDPARTDLTSRQPRM